MHTPATDDSSDPGDGATALGFVHRLVSDLLECDAIQVRVYLDEISGDTVRLSIQFDDSVGQRWYWQPRSMGDDARGQYLRHALLNASTFESPDFVHGPTQVDPDMWMERQEFFGNYDQFEFPLEAASILLTDDIDITQDGAVAVGEALVTNNGVHYRQVTAAERLVGSSPRLQADDLRAGLLAVAAFDSGFAHLVVTPLMAVHPRITRELKDDVSHGPNPLVAILCTTALDPAAAVQKATSGDPSELVDDNWGVVACWRPIARSLVSPDVGVSISRALLDTGLYQRKGSQERTLSTFSDTEGVEDPRERLSAMLWHHRGIILAEQVAAGRVVPDDACLAYIVACISETKRLLTQSAADQDGSLDEALDFVILSWQVMLPPNDDDQDSS